MSAAVDRSTLPPLLRAPSALIPAITKSTLGNGLRVWTLPHNSLPVVALSVLIDVGTADDPATLPGLTALTIDMLDEGADGLDAYRALAPALLRLLAPQGRAVIELGKGQVAEISGIMDAAGLRALERRQDLAGVERCLVLGHPVP